MSDPVDVLVQQLDEELPLPSQAHPGDAGLDLHAATACVIEPGARALVPTGLAIALPNGYAAFVHPRSGLAIRDGVTVVNAPGTIDAGYRGEIKVGLVNLDTEQAITIERGDRIAQLVVQRVEEVRLHPVERLPGSARSAGGFGSSGRAAFNGEPTRDGSGV